MENYRATVFLAGSLRSLANNHSKIYVTGDSLSAIVKNLSSSHPALYSKIADSDGSLRRFVNVYIDGNEARNIDGDPPVSPTSDVRVMLAVAGG